MAYEFRLDEKYPPLTRFDVAAENTLHCPHAHGRTVVLMIERATVKPAGD